MAGVYNAQRHYFKRICTKVVQDFAPLYLTEFGILNSVFGIRNSEYRIRNGILNSVFGNTEETGEVAKEEAARWVRGSWALGEAAVLESVKVAAQVFIACLGAFCARTRFNL
jgi:hypothetical protein